MLNWKDIGSAVQNAGPGAGLRVSSLLLKKRILIPALALATVFMVRVDLLDRPNPEETRERISGFIDAFDPPRAGAAERERVIAAILRESERLEIPDSMRIDGRPIHKAYLLTAFIRVESSFDPRARSRSDALGYMQLKHSTVAWMDEKTGARTSRNDLFQAEVNVARGVDYINLLIRDMNEPRLATLAYNAGPNAVRRGIYDEEYWRRVLKTYRQLRSGEFVEEGVAL